MKKITLFLSLLIPLTLLAQEKKSLTHDDYDSWNRINNVSISNNGTIVSYEITPNTKRGDGKIEIFNKQTSKTFIGERGSAPTISFENKFVYYKRKPAYQLTRQEKLDKVKKEKQTKNDVFIYSISDNKIIDSIGRISSFKSPEKYDNFIAALCLKEVKDKKAYKKLDSVQKLKADKTINSDFLVLIDVVKKTKDTFYNVQQYKFSEKGKFLFYRTETEKDKNNAGIFKIDLKSKEVYTIDSGKEIYKNFGIDKDGTKIAFLASLDSLKHENPKFDLNYWDVNGLQIFVDSSYRKLKDNTILSSYKTPAFSDKGNRLYFYTQSKPRKFVKDTTILEEELADVDIWSWHDKMIQPEQNVRKKRLKEKSYLSYINLNTNNIVELNNKKLASVNIDIEKEEPFIIATDSRPYDVERSWAYPWRKDFHLVNTATGHSKRMITRGTNAPKIDPTGKYAIYFNGDEKNWFVYDIKTGNSKNITAQLEVPFYDEDDDHPMLPGSHGLAGFTSKNQALIYDKYDIWQIDLSGDSAPKNITKTGRATTTTYRVLKLEEEDRNEISYLNKSLLLRGYNEITKANGIFTLNLKTNKISAKLSVDTKNFRLSKKASKSNNLIYTRQNFNEFPNIWITDKNFKQQLQISHTNSHKKDFKWGTVELIKWKAFDGVELEGLLYKPENFDPNKKYPLITYFYEKRSQSLHNFSVPTPSASIVNMPYLISNGYVAFIPDIVYQDGHPGNSAFNCIISGVEAVEKLGFIDSDKMALQGQSWGGYQTAYLVTKTNKFAAAMAGAPVSNMTSAYGGIRWGSGLNRAFQYERTQSRIGKTLWEKGGLELYIENSPLFFIDKIETPMLIMHNDNDGAVPWYQGIEYFMGLRRLQKPVWMLTYNNEAHNLKKVKNKQDLSIRMMQFFDHYLKGEKAPVWMTKGVDILSKKKHYGYELED